MYGLVGQADRVVGVTDRKVWWFDFGGPVLRDGISKGRKRRLEGRGEGKGVAYFRHRDGVLAYSSASFHPDSNTAWMHTRT